MEKPTTYNGFVSRIKKMNPDLPYKKVLNLASELWAEEKKNKKSKISSVQSTEAEESGTMNPYVLSKLEQELGYKASTINEVKAILVAVKLIDHEIVEDGKKGANTLIHVELPGGERLPAKGSFVVFN